MFVDQKNTIKHCVLTKHGDVAPSSQMVSNKFDHCPLQLCEWMPVIFKIYKTWSNRYPGVQVSKQKHLNKIKHCLIKKYLILFKWWPNISHIVRAEGLSLKCGEWLRCSGIEFVYLVSFLFFLWFFCFGYVAVKMF